MKKCPPPAVQANVEPSPGNTCCSDLIKKKKLCLPVLVVWPVDSLKQHWGIAGLYDKNADASFIVNGLSGLRRPDRVPRRKHNSQNAQGQLTLMPTSPCGERNHQSMS